MTISVTEFDDSTVSYEVVCEPGDELFLEYGRAVVTEKTEDTIYARYEGDTDTTFFVRKFNTWVPVHITDVTEDELHVEIDHYNYKIRVESVEKDAIEPDEWTAEAGDFVKMRYIGYYEDGEVFDSSFANVDEVTPDMTLDNSYAHNAASLTVKPGTTLQGTNTMITGVNEALKGMGVGDEKTITVPPEDGYGEWDEDKVREIPFVVGEYPIIETLEKDVTMTVEEFLNAYQGDPYEGNQVELPYGQGTIVSVSEGTVSIEVTSLKGADEAFTYENLQTKVIDESDDTFTIERLTEDGKAIPVQGATAIAHVEGDTIVVAFDPDDYAVGDRFGNGSITEITDDAFVVDANHPMAGKTLMFKLRVVAVKKVA
jgi:FKBP-type peptidyl-prolyl cis-trans isomerase 2